MQVDNYLVVSSQYPQLSPQCYEIARCTAEKIDQNNLHRLPNTFVLLYRIGRDEGILRGLWRGVGPNIGRGTFTTAAQVTLNHAYFLINLINNLDI